MTKKQSKMLKRIISAAVLFLLIQIIPFEKINIHFPFRFILYIIDYLIISYDILKKAFLGIINCSLLDENFLMAVASLGAFALAVYSAKGNLFIVKDCNEAVAVMLFYQIGEFFQSYAVGKSRKNIAKLMDIRPDYANIYSEGKIEKVDPNEIKIGQIIIVNPGEKIPLDGIITEGSTSLNTVALTGESTPVEVKNGDMVSSGSININGVIKIKTTKPFGESTVSKILELVENASSKKSKSEEFISKFARVYTPFVCGCALALCILPPLFRIFILNTNSLFSIWLYRSLTFLVISCPCALVVSIPLSFFAGLGGASSNGILIKGSNYLETLSKTKTIVFDKTGTLTKGIFTVTAIHHNTLPETELLEYACLAESASSHPISKSLKEAFNKPLDLSLVKDIQETGGHGIKATVKGKEVIIGNDKIMKKYGIEYKPCHLTGTIINIAIDRVYQGHIVISDVVKENSKKTIKDLKHNGITKTVMLTGDSAAVALDVGKNLEIDEIKSELLPQDKVNAIEEMFKNKAKNEIIAFAGDGINDAPVLTRADIGIAMGAMGADAAIEAADVVLMDDDPLKIVKAIKISRKCIRIVYENIIFALGIKAACLILGAAGIANMWYAIFADVGVLILAILNAIRALNVKNC